MACGSCRTVKRNDRIGSMPPRHRNRSRASAPKPSVRRANIPKNDVVPVRQRPIFHHPAHHRPDPASQRAGFGPLGRRPFREQPIGTGGGSCQKKDEGRGKKYDQESFHGIRSVRVRIITRFFTNVVSEARQIARDARTNAGFPPKRAKGLLRGWKTKESEAAKPILPAREETLVSRLPIEKEDWRMH